MFQDENSSEKHKLSTNDREEVVAEGNWLGYGVFRTIVIDVSEVGISVDVAEQPDVFHVSSENSSIIDRNVVR